MKALLKKSKISSIINTEKSNSDLVKYGKYYFSGHISSTKNSMASDIKRVFGVNVVKINALRSVKSKQNKRFVVTLSKGQSINFQSEVNGS